jgi:uncharacterized membrane protein YuzA (DUF378 family)
MIALIPAVVGAINWGLVGLFRFDLVATITGAGKFGKVNGLSRTIYTVVGIAGILTVGVIPILRRKAAQEQAGGAEQREEWRPEAAA